MMFKPHSQGIVAVLLTDAIFSPLLRILDIGPTFRRYFLAPFAKTQEAMNMKHKV